MVWRRDLAVGHGLQLLEERQRNQGSNAYSFLCAVWPIACFERSDSVLSQGKREERGKGVGRVHFYSCFV